MFRRADELPIIDSQGELTSPSSGAIAADTGIMTKPGNYEIYVVACASAAAKFSLQHRDGNNTGNVDDPTIFYCGENAPVEFIWHYFVNKLERVRVVMAAALVGTCAVSISVKRVG
jgi:hypothetical protein